MKKKNFLATTELQSRQFSSQEIEQVVTSRDSDCTNISSDSLVVNFPANSVGYHRFDFSKYMGFGYDEITEICFKTVAKLVIESQSTNNGTLSVTSIVSYCNNGLANFFSFLSVLSAGLGKQIGPSDISPSLVKKYIQYLNALDVATTAQRSRYTHTKSVLVACFQKGYLPHVKIRGLFPLNPFPNINKKYKGEKALSQTEKKQLVIALKKEMFRLHASTTSLDQFDLTICLVSIALSTGMNPSSLLNLPVDCIQPHPLKSNLRLLVAYKRRGNNTHIVALRSSENLALLQSINLNVANTVQLIVERNEEIRSAFSDPWRLFVHSIKPTKHKNARSKRVSSLSSLQLGRMMKKLVEKHEIKNDDEQPLDLNIMRLRKTFINRIWELSGQDPLIAARHGKHSLQVANQHYWEAPPEAERNMRFLGEVRIKALRVNYSQEETTPVAGCNDIKNGHLAPGDGNVCTELLGCFRCKSFVVTQEDLYRLLSFYWAVVRERDSFGAKRWQKYFRNIIRIIDDEITPRFDKDYVATQREKSRIEPHPYWKDLSMLRLSR